MPRSLFLPLLVTVLTCTAGCGGSGPAAATRPSAAPAAPTTSAAAPGTSSGGAAAATVPVQVGSGTVVRAEVADTPEERAVGLMRRDVVPPGTGMVFTYDAPSYGRYYMFDVRVPLTAVFASGGRVVGVLDMPTCPETDPAACPTYGPDAPFDTVLETAPETLRGRVSVGDPLVVQPG